MTRADAKVIALKSNSQREFGAEVNKFRKENYRRFYAAGHWWVFVYHHPLKCSTVHLTCRGRAQGTKIMKKFGCTDYRIYHFHNGPMRRVK